MRKYIDLLGCGGIVALVVMSAVDMYIEDDNNVVQPITYQQKMPCNTESLKPNLSTQNCSTAPNYQEFELPKKRTFDIHYETPGLMQSKVTE